MQFSQVNITFEQVFFYENQPVFYTLNNIVDLHNFNIQWGPLRLMILKTRNK